MDIDHLLNECTFHAVRSSGAGGQHVNKTASKVELTFNLHKSEGLSKAEKERIGKKLSNKITQEGMLILQCGETRSQHRNKAIVIQRFITLLQQSVQIPKKRKKTKPTRSAIEKRIKAKKKQALKKQNRKPPKLD